MQRAGVVEASEARIANRAFHFADVSAEELMTPRTEIEAVPRTSSLRELLDLAATTRHSRWLVFDGSLDNVVGMLPVRSLFGALHQSAEAFALDPLIRPVLVIPSTSPVAGVLEELRKDSQQVAVVLDEFGGTAGMLTLQDIAEALIGSVENEVSPEPAPTDGSLVLDGLTRLSELEERVDLPLDLETLDVDTLGGLVMQRLGRVPVPGDEVGVGDLRLRVEAVDGHRAARVRIGRAPRIARAAPTAGSSG
jgi:CBS domain containing-hemolysin-like protein